MNFQGLTKAQKASMKPLVSEVRKQLYGTNNNKALLKDGVVVNFGKRAEERITVKVQIVA